MESFEIVADSEGEEYSNPISLPEFPDQQEVPTGQVSSIQTATFPTPIQINDQTGTSNISACTTNPKSFGPSISTFTSIHNTITTPSDTSSSKPNPRPRPRPLKKAGASVSPNVNTNTDTSLHLGDSSIDDASLPNIKIASFNDRVQDAIPFPFPNASIAERAKMRSRNVSRPALATASRSPGSNSSSASTNVKRKSAQRTKSVPIPAPEVIELTSDDEFDELALNSSSPARTKAKPKKKTLPKPKPVKPNRTAHHSPVPESQTIPLPTSSFPQPPPNAFPLTSQLPPSDPPPPTSTAADSDLPPIAVLSNLDSDDAEPGRELSPLFSPLPRISKKRKRPIVDDLGIPEINMDVQMMPQPPPNFFASSSSAASARPEGASSTTDASASTPISASASVKKAAAPRKRKKRGELDEGQVGVVARPKPKGEGKGAKAIQHVEVVIGAKVKGKKGKEKEKEVFKSNEFIEDDEDDDLMIGAGDNASTRKNTEEMKAEGLIGSGKPNSAISALSSVPDSEDEMLVEQALASGTGRKRKNIVPDSDQESGTEMQKKKKPPPGKTKLKAKPKGKGKTAVILSEDDGFGDEEVVKETMIAAKGKEKVRKDKRLNKAAKTPLVEDLYEEMETEQETKENHPPGPQSIQLPSVIVPPALPSSSKISRSYSIAPRNQSTPMSELIRRVNSLPGSPFPASPALRQGLKKIPGSGLAYSPYLKSSRSALSRIAPLHPNRRTPPPPLPPPPPRKKTKKELEREEKWEEELVESVGGISEWACLTDADRREMRKVKFEREMGGYED